MQLIKRCLGTQKEKLTKNVSISLKTTNYSRQEHSHGITCNTHLNRYSTLMSGVIVESYKITSTRVKEKKREFQSPTDNTHFVADRGNEMGYTNLQIDTPFSSASVTAPILQPLF